MLNHLVGLFYQPRKEWQSIGAIPDESLKRHVPFIVILSLIPAVAWYFGTTEVGWRVGDGELVRISADSALSLVAVFYVAMIAGVCGIGYFIHWMAKTYGGKTYPMKGIVIATYTAAPILLAGVAGAYPVFWLDIIIATVAVGYSLYLLYLGIPIMTGVSEDRGFLFSSAVVMVGLIAAVLVMVGTVLFWAFVAEPTFV
ncbi:Yip1 family protein [Biformimicrobium ophioploci]|uniref:Yip1 family protein n=1 Tax=Biformimicrobium ophioploci TaxID=3036711 RepID=A0ABQ6LYL6_9GAMM|nr:Yip1 family protein [Microbulbifer sp. NKW57]GMG87182.1 Yip1 family protein [Microbulbifer sp. NKW57]